MTKSMAEPGGLERIWEHAIMPLLRERFYGTGDDVGHLELAAIRKAIEGPAEP